MDALSYKCPSCGGKLNFDPALQKCKCEYCLGSFTIPQLERQAQKSSPAQEPAPQAGGDDTRAYSCPSCGAQVITDAVTSATSCCYCHNPVLLSDKLSGQYLPGKIIPFKLTRQNAIDALFNWCGKKKFLPRDFLSQQQMENITGIYIPYWLLDCDLTADFRAQATRVTTWSDSKYIHTKTDIYDCARQAELSFRMIPHDASTKADNRVMESIEPFDYRQIEAFNTSYLTGFLAERYDEDQGKITGVLRDRVKTVTKRVLYDSIVGYNSVTESASNIQPRSEQCHYALLPIWMMTYIYHGKTYFYAMNGQTGKAFGVLPLSRAKLAVLFGAVTAAVFALCFLGGLLL